jgi:hypothetical protein
MEMTSAKAMLVDPGDLAAGDAVTTTIPRAAIEEALASGEPTDLYLEVVRPAAAGASDAATVSVAWERPDLERLLLGTSSDTVTFAFRASELERAIEQPEFEGHGLRETAAVLAVAAAAAATASSAAAKPVDVSGAPATAGGAAVVATVHDETIADARTGAVQETVADQGTVIPYLSQGQGVDPADFGGTAPSAEQPTVIPYLSQGQGVGAAAFGGTPPAAEQTPAAEQPTVVPYLSQGVGVDATEFGGAPPSAEQPTVVPYLSQGAGVDASQFSGDAAAPPVHDEALAAARTGSIAASSATHDEATLAARGIEAAPVHDEASLAARGIDAAPVAVHDEATLVGRGIEQEPVSSPDSGFELPSVDPGTAAAVGGAVGGTALLIAAAAFAARGRRPIKPV